MSNMSNSTSIKLWILKNYQVLAGAHVTTAEILNQLHADKENTEFRTVPSAKEVGTLLQDLFGEQILRKRKKEANLRTTEYQNLSFTQFTGKEEINEIGKCYHGWILLKKTGDLYNFAKVNSVHVHGTLHTINLNIDFGKRELSVCGINEIVANEEAVGLVKDEISIENLEFLLYSLNLLKICIGFAQNEKAEKVIRTDNDKLCSRVTVQNEANETSKNVISKRCSIFVAGFRSNQQSTCCSECCIVRKRLYHRESEFEHLKKTKNCLLGRKEMTEKMRLLQREKQNSLKRVQYWQDKFNKESLPLEETDNSDLRFIFDGIKQQDVPEGLEMLLSQQKKALEAKGPSGRRWHPKIVKFCIDIFAASPKAYGILKKSLVLPSKRLISIYKNGIEAEGGWNPEVFDWLRREAARLGLEEKDKWGGLMFDEMTIQEDMAFIRSGNLFKLAGCVNLGKAYENVKVLTTGTNDLEVAKKVVQFALVTDNGFRFALAHFAITTMPAVTLGEKVWEGIEWIMRAGFKPYWLLCDGGEPNRSFIKMCFEDPDKENFVTYNIKNGRPLVIMADCKHNFKKLRNNISKSSSSGRTPRHLINNNRSILFQHWRSAFDWDQASHTMKYNEKLTHQHFDLDGRSKMRNSLAEDLLDAKMLHLMVRYQEHLSTLPGKDPTSLDETIKLLSYTSEMLALFSSRRPIEHSFDERISKCKEFMEYLREWKKNAADSKHFLSDQLWFDLRSMTYGLEQMVKIKVSHFPNAVIKPVIINQDVLENIFCQVRGFNAQNDHPNYALYMSTINTVNITQSSVSKKGNTSGSSDMPEAELPNPHPFKKTKHQ